MMRRRLSASGRRAIASASASSGLRADARHDVVVVGGGVMGVWTAIALAKRGASVCLAEQFAPAHEKGSSHGDGRIYRLAYTEDIYVDMMRQSLPMWHDLQDFAQTPLLHETGGLNIAPVDSGLLDEQGALYARRGIAHEWLSAGEVNARFPQYGLPTSGPRQMRALFQPDFGVLFASKCVAAAWEYAAHLGVETVTGFRATALHDEGGESGGLVVADANGRAIRASAVVLAAGPWLTSLASALLGAGAPAIPTVVSAETVCFYAPKRGMEAAHSYEAMPVFIPEFDNGLGPFGYYGLPMIDVPGIKCSAHYCGPLVDPDCRPAAAGGDAGRGPGGGGGGGGRGGARRGGGGLDLSVRRRDLPACGPHPVHHVVVPLHDDAGPRLHPQPRADALCRRAGHPRGRRQRPRLQDGPRHRRGRRKPRAAGRAASL